MFYNSIIIIILGLKKNYIKASTKIFLILDKRELLNILSAKQISENTRSLVRTVTSFA